MPSQFDALADSDESSSEEEENAKQEKDEEEKVNPPSYEDLSVIRTDEETVLNAVYGDDFHKKNGPWGSLILCVSVRPPDTQPDKVGSKVQLNIQIGKKYPYVIPKVTLNDVKGLSSTEQGDLVKSLVDRCNELSQIGSVMVCELVQLTEEYLLHHNIDPTMSAYDTMKAREEEEAEKIRRLEKEQNDLLQLPFLNSSLSANTHQQQQQSYDEGYDQLSLDTVENDRIQKELDRRDAALNNGERKSSKIDEKPLDKDGYSNIFSIDDDDDDDDDDYNDDFQFNNHSNSKGSKSNSRYVNDFIEKGMVGRGGGGTVFRVRNRLDRRIYAVKKVILQSEQGETRQLGKLENSKLRREVTTISRMKHKNIVQYYHAWVEGSGDDMEIKEDKKTGGKEEEESLAMTTDDDDGHDESDDSSSDESEKGFWGKHPKLSSDFDDFMVVDEEDYSNSWSDSSSDATSTHEGPSSLPPTPIIQGKSNALDHDTKSNFDSDEDSILPIMGGLGFETQSYSDLFKRNEKNQAKAYTADSSKNGALELQKNSSSMFDQFSSQRKNDNSKGSNSIMYIQMEYCPRDLVSFLGKIEINEGWKMIRQILEALVYIHKRKVIHRDLKPGNIFLDVENNIRLGDFGLATTRTNGRDSILRESLGSITKGTTNEGKKMNNDSNQQKLGDSVISSDSAVDFQDESITGGVGTTFYIAPEQAAAGRYTSSSEKGLKNDYDMKADIFSLGIVVFEMFYPFETFMERAYTLQQLRGDNVVDNKFPSPQLEREVSGNSLMSSSKENRCIIESDDWKHQASQRFPKDIDEKVAPEIQKLILWCLERFPENRPSAEQLLASKLIPRQMELDHRYLRDALQTIANPESESHDRIIEALFDRHTMQEREITYDTDDIAKAQKKTRNLKKHGAKKRPAHPIELLGKSLDQIGGFTSSDVQGIRSSFAMNVLSMSAATSTLRRAKGAGKLAKGEVLRNATRHAATVLAMSSATAVAAVGRTIGVNGADPRVVKSICDQLISLFESHGAIPLKAPLLRPKSKYDISMVTAKHMLNEPAEVINERGNNLLLPEDLQVNFARTIGRSGGALSNIKRYDIGTSYLKSISGGHPREHLEASYDIILENHLSNNEIFMAEVIMLVCQAFSILSPQRVSDNSLIGNTNSVQPIWILRLTHTRLADAILDICGIPSKELLRKTCYHILTCCTAPPPSLLSTTIVDGKKFMGKRRKNQSKKKCNEYIEKAIREHKLPQGAATSLRAFLNSGCLPLPANVSEALNVLQKGTQKLRSMENRITPRRQKRYEDVLRCLRTIKNCLNVLQQMGIHFNNNSPIEKKRHFPAYISLDLGLRQPTHHYHGQIYFQAIMLTEGPETILSNDTLLSGDGKGIKFAEGGRYDELVRRFRPPGNFTTSQVDQYTTAPIPICTGARFMVGTFVERVYVEATLRSRRENDQMASLTADSDILRRVLAIPHQLQKGCVQCVIVGTNGFDTATLTERAMVASHLWNEGISAEYIPHSGVILSLLKRSEADTSMIISETNEWTLDQICDLCCLLHIPFVVVVQQHLLRESEKKSVRLRHTNNFSFSSAPNSMSERFILLENLASEIKDNLSTNSSRHSIRNEKVEFESSKSTNPENAMARTRSRSISLPDRDYVYVDSDQFYFNPDSNNKNSGERKDPKLKSVLKLMKRAQLKADPYIEKELRSILAVDLPFRTVREFNTVAMFSDAGQLNCSKSIVSLTTEYVTKQASKHQKTLKTYAQCLDFMLRRCKDSDNSNSSPLTILVYATSDDRFDLLTIEIIKKVTAKNAAKNHHCRKQQKRSS